MRNKTVWRVLLSVGLLFWATNGRSQDMLTLFSTAAPSEMGRVAIEKANALLDGHCACALVAKQAGPVTTGVSNEQTPVYFVTGGPAAKNAIFVPPEINAVLVREQLVRNLIHKLVQIDQDFLRQVEGVVATSDQLPDGFSVSGPVHGREFTLAGLRLMAAYQVNPSDMLAFLLVHEVAHIRQNSDGSAPLTDERKELEREADAFASDVLASALRDPERSAIAAGVAKSILVAGFHATGIRLEAGRETIVDEFAFYEDWELRFFRATERLYATFEGLPTSAEVSGMLDDVLIARGELTPEESMAHLFLRQLEAATNTDRAFEDIDARLQNPALFSLDPERADLLMNRASLLYRTGSLKLARTDLQHALRIYDALGVRSSRSGWNVIGALAVIESELNNIAAGKAYCREIDRLKLTNYGAPPKYLNNVDRVCEGNYK